MKLCKGRLFIAANPNAFIATSPFMKIADMNILFLTKVNNLHSGFIELVQKLKNLLIGSALPWCLVYLLHLIFI